MSKHVIAAATAARCAARTELAESGFPNAHRELKLFGAENVKSNPVTPSRRHALPNR